MQQLTRDSLHGVWAAIATPFNEDDRFDEAVFRENFRRLSAAGVHGIYTTDADGEFYAIELSEFRRIADVLADESERTGTPTMVGATWPNTAGVVDRLAYAADRGIGGAHVGHPPYMPLSRAALERFWSDISAAVPEWFGFMHYNTPRCPNYLKGSDYAELADRFPKLIGTKHVGTEFTEWQTVMARAPNLSHFVTEPVYTPYSLFGARGINSWFVNFNPKFVLDWHADLVNGRWKAAQDRQDRISAFMRAMDLFHDAGHLHGIVGKAVSACSDFLMPCRNTRRPYLPVTDEELAAFRRVIDEDFSDLKWHGEFESHAASRAL